MVYANKFSDHDIIGGIVGSIADGGTVNNCNFKGTIRSDVKDWDNRSLQPYIGGIAGQMLTGSQTNNKVSGTLNFSNLNPDVTWWAWFQTYHFNQQLYCKTVIGKND